MQAKNISNEQNYTSIKMELIITSYNINKYLYITDFNEPAQITSAS
jgi:hypothetical protein